MWTTGRTKLTGKNESTERKICPIATSSTTDSTERNLGSNTSLFMVTGLQLTHCIRVWPCHHDMNVKFVSEQKKLSRMHPASSHHTSFTVKLTVYDVVTVAYVKIMATSSVTPV